jgi:hypothetical protein
MKRKLACLLLAAVFLLPGLARAVTDGDFEVKTTQSIMNLCTASVDDPRQKEAIHFCHGYLVGAYDYYAAMNAGPEGKRLVCFPDPPPSRNEAIAMLLEWIKAHPQYMDEKPVETEFRFLIEKWPCKR